jgi:hypothetical protein
VSNGDSEALRNLREEFRGHVEHRVTDAAFRATTEARIAELESKVRYWRGVAGSAAVGTFLTLLGFAARILE